MNSDLEVRVLDDLNKIAATLMEDGDGHRANAIVAYLGQLAQTCSDDLKDAATADEQRACASVLECLFAAQRVVTQHWETTHASVLVPARP